ncbi:7TM diverse intracellular signaling domain-containing protein [uncultured Fibrella sp.]|uniref:sensor histidine kinase n=1 Tax=uncultured Fibrella sp. TaxID=1284596 RepID=UPI0035CA975E
MKLRYSLLLVWLPGVLLAQSLPIRIDATGGSASIDGRQVEVLADPEHRIGWADVRRDVYSARFKPSPVANLNFGFSTADYWARLSLRVNDPNTPHVLDIGFTNYTLIELYSVDSAGRVNISRVGDGLKGPNRREFPFYTFGIRLPSDQYQTLYLHLVSHYGQQYFPLTVWTEKAYVEAGSSMSLLWGGFYGILLIVLCYHAFIYAFTRERSYLLLCGYLVAYIAYECCRSYNRLPDIENSILTSGVDPQAVVTIFPVPIILFMLFYDYSLRITQYFKWFRWLIVATAGWCLCCVTLAHIYPVTQLSINRLAAWEGIPVGLIMIAVSTALWIKGVRIARFYALASMATAGGAILMMMQRAGFIGSETLLVKFGFNIGSLLEFILLTLGVADRFREERKRQRADELERVRQETQREAEHQLAIKQERERMSIELHNDIGNSLMSARLMLNRLDTHMLSPTEQTVYQQLTVTMADTYDRLRDIAHGLNAQKFVRIGLVAELHKLINVLNTTDRVQFDLLVSREADHLPPALQATLYSFATELTQNVLRHAEAEHAHLRVAVDKTSIRLSVRDDGKGLSEMSAPTGQGIRSVQQQAGMLGGSFVLKPLATGGTSAVIVLPLAGPVR